MIKQVLFVLLVVALPLATAWRNFKLSTADSWSDNISGVTLGQCVDPNLAASFTDVVNLVKISAHYNPNQKWPIEPELVSCTQDWQV